MTAAYDLLFIADNLSLIDAQKRYQKRRKKLMDTCSNGLIIISGETESLHSDKPWLLAHLPIYQDPVLLFYTGINQLKAWLILNF